MVTPPAQLWGTKGIWKLERDVPPASPVPDEGEHPEDRRQLLGNRPDPADRLRSRAVGHHRCQQIRGLHPLRPVRGGAVLAPHARPLLPHPPEQAGPGAAAGRGALVVHQLGARRGRRAALLSGDRSHDLQDGAQLLLQPGTVHAPLSVQDLPDGRRVRLSELRRVPHSGYLWGVQEVSGGADAPLKGGQHKQKKKRKGKVASFAK